MSKATYQLENSKHAYKAEFKKGSIQFAKVHAPNKARKDVSRFLEALDQSNKANKTTTKLARNMKMLATRNNSKKIRRMHASKQTSTQASKLYEFVQVTWEGNEKAKC